MSFCKTHSWYSTSWLALVVFVCVKVCIHRHWMHLEYCHNCQSRLVHQASYIIEQFTGECATAKRARYSTKAFATVEFDCKTSSAEHHMVYCCCIWCGNTCMVQYQPVGSCCFWLCKTVHLWTVDELSTWPQQPQLLSPSLSIKQGSVNAELNSL